MKRISLSILSLALTLLTMTSCTKSVTRVSPDQTIDLSGRWNDTDSRLVAEEMTMDALGSAWLNRFYQAKNKAPVMIVGVITNRSSEHIEAETFIKDIEREFIKSSQIRIVQNAVLREKIREERADQQNFSSLDTQKKWGLELGADYMMFGTINSITDMEGRKKVIFYQINLELTDIQTNEIVWIGDKKIKKYIVN
ncbi:penicillin-binding protein activator LpoB [Penaeicola halotolerans]|uniref:penicillin-binding protein activator LpoB n=1 Tax=Penaeicola halotolerans TaxID=2793196 RepID=UPI001CF8F552|nr:penicillin-binding protein activator LpoB [Penaeicola halotolerans]